MKLSLGTKLSAVLFQRHSWCVAQDVYNKVLHVILREHKLQNRQNIGFTASERSTSSPENFPETLLIQPLNFHEIGGLKHAAREGVLCGPRCLWGFSNN